MCTGDARFVKSESSVRVQRSIKVNNLFEQGVGQICSGDVTVLFLRGSCFRGGAG